MNRAQGGYVGLIALLITVALIAFVFWRPDIFSPKTATTTPDGTSDLLQGTTQIEQGQNAIKAAQNAKQLIENNSKQQSSGY